MVKKDDESQNGTLEFASKESTSNNPQLVIVVDLSQAEILFNQHVDVVSELGVISQVSDESVVSDYLVDAITNLKINTQNLVTDVDARNTLVSILDSALQSANDAGNSVLTLDESNANLKITESKNFVDSYSNQVSGFSGTIIPAVDADVLISQANQISNDSLKRGIDSTELILGTPLSVTSQIINIAKLDLAELRNIGDQIVALGFTMEVEARTMSPTQGFVLFFNLNTLQEFESVITTEQLSGIVTVEIFEELSGNGNILNDEQFASILTSMIPIVGALSLNPPVLSRELVIAFFLCRIGGPYVGAVGCGFAAGIIIGTYLQQNPEILQEIRAIVETGAELLQETLNDGFPPELTVIKEVITDHGGSALPNDFTIHVSNAGNQHTFQGKSAPGETRILIPGTFSVTEDIDPDYTPTLLGECSGTVGFGDAKTCTITNNDVAPKLTVIKRIINDDGGSLTLADVTLKIDNVIVANGTEHERIAGTYQVSEDPISGYDPSFSVDCPNGVVTLDVGEEKTCTITNDDVSEAVFFENFDGPTIQGVFGFQWIFNAPGSPVPGFTNRGSVATSFQGFDPPSTPNWGVKSLIGSGTCRSNLSTAHFFFFDQLPAGDYELSGTLASTPCSPCVVTTAVRVVSVPGGLVGSIEHRGQNLGSEPLNVTKTVATKSTIISSNGGTHGILASMSPDFLCSGTVSGGFDNISLTPVGAQATSSAEVVGGPYFYTEINQTSINATKPTQITVPLKVEWVEGYYAEPVIVQLLIGNGTYNGISGNVTSIQNATMFQMYDLTFDISDSAPVGQEHVGVLVTEMSTGDSDWKSILFNIFE